MQTSAAVPLISMRSVAAAKWSGWLMSKESTRPTGSLPSYTKSANISYRTPAVVTLQRAHKKHSVTQPSVPDIVRRPNKRAGMQAAGQVGNATGGE